MQPCRGCNLRLELVVGTSGFCGACFLAVKIERLVFTRAPPHGAPTLIGYLSKVVNTIEDQCERFEADRTAGYADHRGKPLKDQAPKEKGAFETGTHPGDRHPEAGGASSKDKPEPKTESPCLLRPKSSTNANPARIPKPDCRRAC